MGFWDQYEDVGSLGSFISADEKAVLMDNGIPMTVTKVVQDNHNQYGERYVAQVQVPNPETGDEEERAISFPIGTVESRDRMLSQMSEYLAGEGAEPVVVKLEKKGRSILLRQA